MSENLETVRRFLVGVNSQDLDAALLEVALGAELDWSRSDAPDGGVHRGRDAWRRWLSERQEGLQGARFEPTEMLEAPPDRVLVVAHMRGTGRASGLEIGALGAGVLALHDGQITRLTLYQTRAEAAEAAGLSP